MEEKFSFDKVGKEMPWKVSESLFSDVEKNVIQEVAPRRSARTVKILAASIAAACVAICTFVFTSRAYDVRKDLVAFEQLSESDQAYLLEIYDEDIFIQGYGK